MAFLPNSLSLDNIGKKLVKKNGQLVQTTTPAAREPVQTTTPVTEMQTSDNPASAAMAGTPAQTQNVLSKAATGIEAQKAPEAPGTLLRDVQRQTQAVAPLDKQAQADMMELEKLKTLGQARVTVDDWIKAAGGQKTLSTQLDTLPTTIQEIDSFGRPVTNPDGTPKYIEAPPAAKAILDSISSDFTGYLTANGFSGVDLFDTDKQKQIQDFINAQIGNIPQAASIVNKFLDAAKAGIKTDAILSDMQISAAEAAAALTFGDTYFSEQQIKDMSVKAFQDAVAAASASYSKNVSAAESILADPFASPAMKEAAQADLMRMGATGEFASAHSFRKATEEIYAVDDVIIDGKHYDTMADVLKDDRISRIISTALMTDEEIKDSPALKEERDRAVKWLESNGIYGMIKDYSSAFKSAASKINPILQSQWRAQTEIRNAMTTDLGIDEVTLDSLLGEGWKTKQYKDAADMYSKNPTLKLLKTMKDSGENVTVFVDLLDQIALDGNISLFTKINGEEHLRNLERNYSNWSRYNKVYKDFEKLQADGIALTESDVDRLPLSEPNRKTIKTLMSMGISSAEIFDDIINSMYPFGKIEEAVLGNYKDFVGISEPFGINLTDEGAAALIAYAKSGENGNLVDTKLFYLPYKVYAEIENNNNAIRSTNANQIWGDWNLLKPSSRPTAELLRDLQTTSNTTTLKKLASPYIGKDPQRIMELANKIAEIKDAESRGVSIYPPDMSRRLQDLYDVVAYVNGPEFSARTQELEVAKETAAAAAKEEAIVKKRGKTFANLKKMLPQATINALNLSDRDVDEIAKAIDGLKNGNAADTKTLVKILGVGNAVMMLPQIVGASVVSEWIRTDVFRGLDATMGGDLGNVANALSQMAATGSPTAKELWDRATTIKR
jgi:hypothetical protein